MSRSAQKEGGYFVSVPTIFGPQRWIELAIPGAETGIVLFTPPGHEGWIGTLLNASLFCNDVHTTYEELVARGVEFTSPPQRESWGTSATLKDCEGNLLLIAGAS